jgi:hypothetical protein
MLSSSSKQGSDSSSASLSKGSIDMETMFADVKPILQDDGPSPVCAIAYPPDFEEAMNYFRALLLANEYSSRALELTAICLKFNPANYTVWHFRRECLKALSTSTGGISIDMDLVENDLEFSAAIGGSNPKNYQIWYHRRALLESILDTNLHDKIHVSAENWKERIFDVTRKELMYVSIVLNEDAKNYHVSRVTIDIAIPLSLVRRKLYKYSCLFFFFFFWFAPQYFQGLVTSSVAHSLFRY